MHEHNTHPAAATFAILSLTPLGSEPLCVGQINATADFRIQIKNNWYNISVLIMMNFGISQILLHLVSHLKIYDSRVAAI